MPQLVRAGARLRRGVAIAFSLACFGPVAADAQAPATEGAHAVLPGIRLWYLDTGGSGQAVVLLHAATGSSRVWEFQIPALTAAGYRVIAYDRRGWGRTLVDSGASNTPTHAADDLVRLADFLRLDRFHLLGTAAGGMVAFDFALTYPHRLRSLTVANSIGGIQDESALETGRRIRPAQFNALPEDLKELGPEYRAANPAGVTRWLSLPQLSRPSGSRSRPQPPKNRITMELLKSITTPTLIIAGGADLYSPPSVMRPFAVHIPNAVFVSMPDVGHSAYWEQPDSFNRGLVSFLNEHR